MSDIDEIGGHTKERLSALRALPLSRKIGFTAARIIEWHNHYHGKVYVSFSGGKDSTVLLYLARQLYPDIQAAFIDTGLEYPEIRKFVKTFGNVDWIRPKLNFREVIEKYGYPVISKEVAQSLRELRARPPSKRNSGCRAEQFGLCDPTGKYGKRYDYSRWKFLLDATFKISDQCCDVMKKRPASAFSKRTGLMPIIATMTEESYLRKTNWIRHGCNALDGKHPKSAPMSFWTEQDVLTFLKLKNLPIASVYGDIIECDGRLSTTGCKRTGCVFCLFGIMSDGTPNRIQRLAETHPALYHYCLDKLGLREVMDFIGVSYKPCVDLFNYQRLEAQNG